MLAMIKLGWQVATQRDSQPGIASPEVRKQLRQQPDGHSASPQAERRKSAEETGEDLR